MLSSGAFFHAHRMALSQNIVMLVIEVHALYNSDNSPMREVVMGLIAAHYRFSSNSPTGVRHMGLLGTCDMNQHPLNTCIPVHNASALWNNAHEWRSRDSPRNGMEKWQLINK